MSLEVIDFGCRLNIAEGASIARSLAGADDTARFAPAKEHLQRIGFGTPDVLATIGQLEERGVEFLASEKVRSSDHGALSKPALGSVMFELVHNELPPAATRR